MKQQSARLVREDGLRRRVETPDGRNGVVLTKDGTGMVIMQQGQRERGYISRDPQSGRLKMTLGGGQEMDVEEVKGEKASA